MDYYNLLNINKNATKEEIKKSYYKLAKQYHPDRNSGDDTKFKKINKAYTILIDDEKKKEYENENNLKFFADNLNQFHCFSKNFFENKNRLNNLSIPDILKTFMDTSTHKKNKKNKYTILVSFNDVYKNKIKKIKMNNKYYFIPLYKREYEIDNNIFYINIKSNSKFNIIDDYDIEHTINISLYEALFEKHILIYNPTEELLRVNINKSILNNNDFFIKNQGLPLDENGYKRGNMYLNFNIIYPEIIDKDYFFNNFPPINNKLNSNVRLEDIIDAILH
jgi:DnaJ-class molecular chaperone